MTGNAASMKARAAAFAEREGRRPRLVLVRLGDHSDDEGANRAAGAFSDAGFDVDYGAPGQTPATAARAAVENDAHAILVATTGAEGAAAEVAQMVARLEEEGAEGMVVACRGRFSEAAAETLLDGGVHVVFDADDDAAEAAAAVLDVLDGA